MELSSITEFGEAQFLIPLLNIPRKDNFEFLT